MYFTEYGGGLRSTYTAPRAASRLDCRASRGGRRWKEAVQRLDQSQGRVRATSFLAALRGVCARLGGGCAGRRPPWRDWGA